MVWCFLWDPSGLVEGDPSRDAKGVNTLQARPCPPGASGLCRCNLPKHTLNSFLIINYFSRRTRAFVLKILHPPLENVPKKLLTALKKNILKHPLYFEFAFIGSTAERAQVLFSLWRGKVQYKLIIKITLFFLACISQWLNIHFKKMTYTFFFFSSNWNTGDVRFRIR